MTLQEMIDAINRRVDDIIINEDGIEWLNAGKNRMAQEIQADFPDIVKTNAMDDKFVFPAKYHEIPVLYASAMYKTQDSSLREVNNLLTLFEESLRTFVSEYKVPPQYRDDDLSQQFTATAGQKEFTITKNSYNRTYGDLKVYINGEKTTKFTKDDDKFKLTTGANADDKVTAIWESHTDLVEPPYNWWKAW